MLGLLIGLLILGIIVYAVIEYNNFVRLRESIKNAWAQIDVQLKRRADLIPNLVEAVKGYMKHEKSLIEEVTKLRTQVIQGSRRERIAANDKLSKALNQIFVAVENYPKLRANENMLALQEELSTTENKIAYARQAYNDSVYIYNAKIKQFPSNIIASLFGFKEEEYLELEAPKEAPKVKF